MALLVMSEPPQASLHTLTSADGSATYSAPREAYRIVAGVNYPVEVPYRSDEIPESTLIEVNLRPHNGVGMVKERHVEQLIKRTLQAIVLGQETPRTMLQVTLQVLSVESDESLPGGVRGAGQGETYLDLLASALNAAILGCLDAAVMMKTLVAAALVGVSRDDGQVMINPGVSQRKKCASLHVFAFSKDGTTLLMESEGKFSMESWQQAAHAARLAVLGHSLRTDPIPSTTEREANKQSNGDVAMNGTDGVTGNNSVICVLDVIRNAMEARVIKDESWRQD
ncbi:3' exoribonuclease family, domain-containing protein [Cladophialophora immunda]|nr:3' exoribonuclease family, domain-containing protein [Cladophialophora immunda]